MKFYEYKGKIYRSRNKEMLARRLFQKALNNWGELVILDYKHKVSQIRIIKGKEKEKYEIQKKASYRRRYSNN